MKENKAVKVFIGGDNLSEDYKEKVFFAIEELRKEGYQVYIITPEEKLPVGVDLPVAQCEFCLKLFRKEKLTNGCCTKCFESLADEMVGAMKDYKR